MALISWVTVSLAGLSSWSDISRLTDKIDRLGGILPAEMIAICNDHHKDNMSLVGYMVPLHERLAKLENSN